ncbi:unnamed protein product [Microthlaspi erraticum]|uniref:Reverse transcriptase domain-containing protein n=1 Tax=Microthlaspi erraticum TaxID=1685480 RepID=A0A6D2KL40_9BRAS|nr:unnamed protein product [Microthlaspi erraticum]
METKNCEEEINKLIPLAQYVSRAFVPPNTPGGGDLALYWKQEIPLQILLSCKSYIDTTITYKGVNFFSTFIYGEPDHSQRYLLWEELTNLGLLRDKPWFLSGDFNDIIDSTEKSGGPQRTEASFGNFRAFLSHSDLFDLQHTGNFLSWRGTRGIHLVHCRLDRAMANSMWFELYPTNRCHYLDYEGSDHRPLLSEFQPEKRKAISHWNREHHTNNRKAINEEKANLEAAMSATSTNTSTIQESNKKLEEAYRKEEESWKQRSRSLWLALGDQNSCYFHVVTRSRKAINKFSVLQDKDGLLVYEEEDFVRVISVYFQDIFITRSPDCTATVSQALIPCITEEINNTLIAIPSNEEIRLALFDIHPDKAPGPDGFSASFFQTNWSVVGERLTMEIRDFFVFSILPKTINETYVRLIPKIHSPRLISDYRPIALCNIFYKIISKVLTKRLQPILPLIISENQTVFVPGRAIADNVLITHETLHYLKCISTVSYSFLVNGAVQGKVLPQRGIRQGDPLSPFIFILCGEVLTGLCNNAQVNGLLPGIKVAKESPRINHLLFADDTMFFCKTKDQNCVTLATILRKYGEASGQQINHQKSSISFSSKTPQDIKERVKLTLGIEKEGGQGKYLGLPESFGRKKKDLFSLIVDRIRQRAVSYSSRRLSTAGKVILIKSVLSAIPTYSMTCFKLPVSLSRVLQGKYCKNQQFLDVPTSNSSSHGWRGVLIGRDLLVEQLGKTIGSGHNTSIWKDSWLSHTSPIRPIGPPTLQNKDAMVDSLMIGSKWNKEKIEELFPQYLPLIMSIRPSIKGAQDAYVWIPSKSGVYTAKTGYHIARALKENQSENQQSSINWNADIWLGNFSLKLKIFLWKILQRALPTGENLLNRGMFENVCCAHCGELETTEHLFFLCYFARKVWSLAPSTTTLDLSSISFEESIKILKRLICLPPSGITSGPLFPWICWTIWSARNYRIFEDRSFSPEDTATKAIQDAREWQEAQSLEKSPPTKHSYPTNKRRIHPMTTLCYTDGSWSKETSIAGAGWVFTTREGTQIDSGSMAEQHTLSPLMAEAIAIRSALMHALEKNFLHL